MAGRTLYCQRCGYHQFVGAANIRDSLLRFIASPELQPCYECGCTTFHPDHPSERDRTWRPPAFAGTDRRYLEDLNISAE